MRKGCFHMLLMVLTLRAEYSTLSLYIFIKLSKNEVNKILEFCNLSWEDDCLEFYKTKRAIKTVSSAQARKPIYKSSHQSYKNYEKFLEEYLSKL